MTAARSGQVPPETVDAILETALASSVSVTDQISTLAAAAKTAVQELGDITIEDDADYTAVDAMLADWHAAEKSAIEMRQGATRPFKNVAATIEGWFRPYLKDVERVKDGLKAKLGAYRLAIAVAEKKARDEATAALAAGDAPAMLAALNTATSMAVLPEGGARATFRWIVKRINRDLLPAEYLCPDVVKIDAIAADHKGDDPPVVPGVIFEREVSIAAGNSSRGRGVGLS